MRILMKEPGKGIRSMVIPNELKMLQDLVGGYIETYTIAEDVAIICNEEGKLLGLPYNCTICGEDFVGTILFVGVGEEDFTDVPESLIRIIAEGHFKEVSA